MWYFAWALGMGFACSFAVLNAMWLELNCDMDSSEARSTRDRIAERFSGWGARS
ncbi:cytochrome bd-I oxidase subunit CydX [Methylohalobius crimeensis]|uniref:cytochrome bd-I oxidase subunit CydX n=1 Tax=Methylohalobius crimeensis TaxID=244365 RepID=UPI0003B3680A|nr:cytochrome bd-I oxidase subunit CydX [Methylohalobius crimeensis]